MKSFPETLLRQQLLSLLAKTTLTISDKQQDQLIGLLQLLYKWNQAYNLTSVRDPEDMLIRHIMDSVVLGPYLFGDQIIDVGTGPGLPGLPLAICYPEKHFVLLDSLTKRVTFIRQVVHILDLKNVTPVLARVQDYEAIEHTESGFDSVISRAFASLADMLAWCHHLPSAEGRFLALKGTPTEAELATVVAPYRIAAIHTLDVPTLNAARQVIDIRRDQSLL